jgi:hypothetical protein
MKNPMHQEPLLQVQAPPLEWIAVNDAILARLAYLRQSPHQVNRSTARLLYLFQQRLLAPTSSSTTPEVPPTPHTVEQMLLRLNQARRQAAKVIHDEAAHKQQQQIVQQAKALDQAPCSAWSAIPRHHVYELLGQYQRATQLPNGLSIGVLCFQKLAVQMLDQTNVILTIKSFCHFERL